MTIDEAIRHCKDVAESKRKQVENGDWEKGSSTERDCIECAAERRQLAEWLKELKAYRELIGKTEEALGRFDLDNTATYTKFYWDCWRVREAKE